MISRASLNYSCLRGAFAQFNSMSGDFNRAWNFLIVQTSLRFLFRCWVDNCSFVFRGHIDQFYNYFCSVRIAVISSAVRVATRYEFFFLHFVKNVLFLIILLPLRKTILQRGKWNMLSPASLSNDFSGNVLSRSNEASSSLCFNFIVIILVWSSYDCQIGSIKLSFRKKALPTRKLKRSAKRVNERREIHFCKRNS